MSISVSSKDNLVSTPSSPASLKEKDQEQPRVEAPAPTPPPPPRSHLSPDQIHVLQELEKLSPSPSIPLVDDPFAAHFLGGALIKGVQVGTEKLEGADFGKMTALYHHLLKEASAAEHAIDNVAVRSAVTGLEQCLLVHAAVNHLKSHLDSWQERAFVFGLWMQNHIKQMHSGDSLLIPGGWMGVTGDNGHAMLYELIKEDTDTFTVKIYNTGGGLEFHPKVVAEAQTTYIQVLCKKGIHPAALANPIFWRGYYEICHERAPTTTTDQPTPTTPEQVYRLFDLIEPGFVESTLAEMLQATSGREDLRRGQRVGNCTGEVLRLYTKEKLEGQKNADREPLYQAIRDRTLIDVLHQYAHHLMDQGILPKEATASSYAPTDPAKALKHLKLFAAEMDTVRRTLLKGIKKNRKGKKQVDALQDQINKLHMLQEKVEQGQRACQAALKEKMQRVPIEQGTKYEKLAFPKALPSSLDPHLPVTLEPAKVITPVSAGETTWPATGEAIAKQLTHWIKQLESSSSQSNNWILLQEIFKTMPSVNHSCWQTKGTEDCIEPLVKLGRLYLNGFVSTLPFSSDHLAIQKCLAVLLHLGKQHDPILADVAIDSSYGSLWTDPHYTTALTQQETTDLEATTRFFKQNLRDNGLLKEWTDLSEEKDKDTLKLRQDALDRLEDHSQAKHILSYLKRILFWEQLFVSGYRLLIRN